MHGNLDVLAEHWFSFLLLAIALVLGVSVLNVWRRRGEWSLPLLLVGSAAALLGVGGLALPVMWGLWLAGAALAILFVMLLMVITTGSWYAPLGYSVGALLLLGLGGAGSSAVAGRSDATAVALKQPRIRGHRHRAWLPLSDWTGSCSQQTVRRGVACGAARAFRRARDRDA